LNVVAEAAPPLAAALWKDIRTSAFGKRLSLSLSLEIISLMSETESSRSRMV